MPRRWQVCQEQSLGLQQLRHAIGVAQYEHRTRLLGALEYTDVLKVTQCADDFPGLSRGSNTVWNDACHDGHPILDHDDAQGLSIRQHDERLPVSYTHLTLPTSDLV